MRRLDGIRHLARRFFRALRARYPGFDDQLFVAGLLSVEEAALFWSQPVQDLDHAVAAAQRVLQARPGRHDLARAALLHDVGKIEAGLGVLGRSVATVLAALRLPLGSRMRAYIDHGVIGARMLDVIGVGGMPQTYTRHHTSSAPPSGMDPDDWDALVTADRG
jgi:hypothetical protein